MRELPFDSYNGAEPYLFISYAHKDDQAVFGIIKALHEKLYRIWYDEGIEVGANWPQVIASHLKNSAAVLIFVSKNSLASQNCMREVNYGVAQKKKSIVVLLDGAQMPEDMGMQLSVAPKVAFSTAEQTAAEVAALLDDSLIGDGITGYERAAASGKKKVNVWFAVAIVALVLLAGLAVYVIGSMNGWFAGKGITKQTVKTEEGAEVSITTFSDAVTRDLLLKSLGSQYVYICGNSIVSDASVIKRDGQSWTVGGQPSARGSITDLSVFEGQDIKQLALVNQSIRDLTGLEKLAGLDYLDISGNDITDLSALAALKELTVLKIEGLPKGADLSAPAGLPSLERVYVSYDMIDSIKPLADAGIEIVVRR